MAAYKKNQAADKLKASADSAARKPGTRPSHSLIDYTGTYTHPGYGAIRIYQDKDSLRASYHSLNFKLNHYHFDVFKGLQLDESGNAEDGEEGMKITFHMNAKGDIHSVKLPFEAAVKEIEFIKKVEPVSLTKGELEQFVGEYDLSGTTVKAYLKADSILTVSLPGQPEYELVPVSKNEFNIKVLSGYSIRFDRDAKGDVNGCQFIQPNGIFKATRKPK
jgi:hypothetical protein